MHLLTGDHSDVLEGAYLGYYYRQENRIQLLYQLAIRSTELCHDDSTLKIKARVNYDIPVADDRLSTASRPRPRHSQANRD